MRRRKQRHVPLSCHSFSSVAKHFKTDIPTEKGIGGFLYANLGGSLIELFPDHTEPTSTHCAFVCGGSIFASYIIPCDVLFAELPLLVEYTCRTLPCCYLGNDFNAIVGAISGDLRATFEKAHGWSTCTYSRSLFIPPTSLLQITHCPF